MKEPREPRTRDPYPHLQPRAHRRDGDCVVYWMTAFRRLHWNFALQQAVGRARELGKPLLILEGLRCGYRWASDRFHRFVLDGMGEHARALARGSSTTPMSSPRRAPARGCSRRWRRPPAWW